METIEIKFNSVNLSGVVETIRNKYILIELKNTREEVGYMELYFRSAKKVTLETIYCVDKYRKHGIGTTLLDISDTLLKNYTGYVLCGEYSPAQMMNDITKIRSDKELDNAARSFYLKHGFNITSYNEFKENTKKFPLININDFNQSIRKISRSVVYKTIEEKDEYRFIDNGNIIIENPTYKCRRTI